MLAGLYGTAFYFTLHLNRNFHCLETSMHEVGNFVFGIPIDSSDIGNNLGHVIQAHAWRAIRKCATKTTESVSY